VTGRLDSFAPDAKIIHADIDPAEIGKNRNADVPIVGDVKLVIESLNGVLRGEDMADGPPGELPPRPQATLRPGPGAHQGRATQPGVRHQRLGQLAGRRLLRGRGGPASDVGCPLAALREARTLAQLSGGAGTMGYCVPAAMGAKVGVPGQTGVWGSTATAASR
jgi:acetolactate synthase-1/2/3 large subunit